jgi:hypothetical protein
MAPSPGSLAWTPLEARRHGKATIVVELSLGGTCTIVDEPGAFIFESARLTAARPCSLLREMTPPPSCHSRVREASAVDAACTPCVLPTAS